MLRLGECGLDPGDEKNVAEYLMRVWMVEGEEIFEPDEKEEEKRHKYGQEGKPRNEEEKQAAV